MPKKKNSDAKIRANNKYSASHYDRINMALPKGTRRLVDWCAAMHGETVNKYVCRAVLTAVKQDLEGEQTKSREFYNLF